VKRKGERSKNNQDQRFPLTGPAGLTEILHYSFLVVSPLSLDLDVMVSFGVDSTGWMALFIRLMDIRW